MAGQQTLQRYWKRCGYVEIDDNAGGTTVFSHPSDVVRVKAKYDAATSLDFRFDGVKYGDVYGRFAVGILGLSTDRIMELTTWNVAKSVRRRRRIRVFAGYEADFEEGKNVNPIFDGYVLSAMPTNSPEMWMNFECIRYYETNQPVVKPETVEDKLTLILARIADINNMEWSTERWHAKGVDPQKKEKFVISGTKTSLIHKFAAKFGVKIVTNPTSASDKNGIFDVYDAKPWLNSAEKISDTIQTETGLLSIGNVDMKGAKLTIRLSDRHGLYDWIKLNSRLVPCANQPYIVVSKHLKGHLRGQEWQTELDCVRQRALI